MKNKKNILFYSTLGFIILITLIIGLFLNFETWYYTPLAIIMVTTVLIRLLSNQTENTDKVKNHIFLWLSLVNFSVYSIVSFYHYTGGLTSFMITFIFMFVLCLIISNLYNRYNNKKFIHLSNILIVIFFSFSILVELGFMSIAGMGV